MFSYRALRSLVSKKRPPSARYQYGELYVNLGDHQLGVIDQDGNPQDLLAITHFSEDATYDAGDHVIYQGNIYIAKAANGPGNFDKSDWASSGSDLSIGDHDPALEYKQGDVVFVSGDNCFLQAAQDIPAGTPFDPDMWESTCQKHTGGGQPPGGGGGDGYGIGDIVTTMHLLEPTVQTARRLVILHGQELDRSGEYAALFAEWGVQFGNGNGASTFNVPDMRGRFLRGVNESSGWDPYAHERTAFFPGPGVNTGDMAGTYQNYIMLKHQHKVGTGLRSCQHTSTNPEYLGYLRRSVCNNFYYVWSSRHEYTGDDVAYMKKDNAPRNISVHWYAQY